MKRLLIIPLVVLGAVSCTKLVYTGIDYPATSDIQVFYDRNEIEREYEVMGMLKASGEGPLSGSGMEGKIIKEAKRRGADAVVFDAAGESTVDRRVSHDDRSMGKLSDTRTLKWSRAYLIKYK